jgi:predicted kinase
LAETISKPRIVLLVGLPGSGKSTWVSGRTGVLSSDSLREVLADDATDQTIHARVFRVLRYLLKNRLELKRPITYIDATSLTPKERQPYIKLAKQCGSEIEAIFFDVPVIECQRRNRQRSRIVPDDVIERMAPKLVPPRVVEGFSRVTVIR